MSYHLYLHLNKKQKKTLIDHLMYFAAVMHPLTATPQIFLIYTTHNVSGISLWTWISFMTLGLVFLSYGILHKMKPYIMMQLLWFVVDTLVVVGILIYR